MITHVTSIDEDEIIGLLEAEIEVIPVEVVNVTWDAEKRRVVIAWRRGSGKN